MKRNSFILMLMLAITVIVSGCGQKSVKPVDIVEGVDRCEVCNMLVADGPHATEIVLKDGKVLRFDDIGDMFRWTKENGTDQVAERFVRDLQTKEWLPIEEASFVYDKNFRTPMAFGVYSFKSKNDAEALIEKEKAGKLMTLADLNTHTWERNMEMMKEMKKQKMQDQQMHDHAGENQGSMH